MSDKPILTTEQIEQLGNILQGILANYPISVDLATHVLANFDAEVDNWSGPRPFTLLYTGWRGASRERVYEDLNDVLKRVGPFHLVVGYNVEKDEPAGGDRYAYAWATLTPGITVETHPAPWHVPLLKRTAGLFRGGLMLGLVLGRGGPHGMLAHLHEKSRGAAGTAAFADHLGVPVWKRPAS
ncbi:hypothetical protein [Streptosporangium sp. NPDC001681]|uniref:hypothetical protein n=1 Tax=Streptosporangium sp. NPDC001681 TaxID=3154395 RepID=UPI00333137BE